MILVVLAALTYPALGDEANRALAKALRSIGG
jgi:hypothetical protein